MKLIKAMDVRIKAQLTVSYAKLGLFYACFLATALNLLLNEIT